jgi:hypothetical protein
MEAEKSKQQVPTASSEAAGSSVPNGEQDEVFLSVIQYV